MDPLKKDDRFAHVAKDPRFHKMARNYRKVKIDKRFEGMMKDDQFKVKYTVDPRGRPINTTSNENLRRFYDLSSEEEDSDEDNEEEEDKEEDSDEDKEGDDEGEEEEDEDSVDEELNKKEVLKKKKKKEIKPESSDEEEKEDEEDGSEEEEESDGDSSVDYARGQGNVESSTEEEFSGEDSGGEELDHGWNEVDKTTVFGVDSTQRLAICNMNWDRMKAVDLFVLLSSFLPSGGVLQVVTIYPSEFGQERMAEEEGLGPREFREKAEQIEQKAEEEAKRGEDSRYHREKLRQYQLNRLKYYYAVAEFDSVAAADHVYQNCDGIEYESSASRLDLRFIPDEMTFDQEPSSQATEFPDSTTYVPSKFLTDALQQSKVHLTWDETDQDRVAFTLKNFSKEDMEDMDVKAYLASDSDDNDGGIDPYAGIEEPDFGEVGESSKQEKNDDDDNENEETQIDKYRALLKGLKDAEQEKEEGDKDMEITWEPGLKGATEDLVTSKEQEEDDPQTPWDSYLDERKQKKKEKKKDKVVAAKSKAEQDEPAAQAFSDDDLPDDLKGSVFQDSLASRKKKFTKKKSKPAPATEEETKQAEELSLLLMDENEEEKGAKHFSLSAIQEAEQLQTKKRKRKKLIARGETVPEVDDFKVDVGDARFNELFDNPLYNIDPSASEYKKTHAMDALVEEKVKRRRINKYKPQTSKSSADQKKSSLSSLVNSVKAKTKSIQEKKVKTLRPN